MAEPLRIRTLAQLRMVLESGGCLVITDTARPRVFHTDPTRCPHVTERSFETKVIVNGGRNGAYFAVGSLDEARTAWPRITVCRSLACGAASLEEGGDDAAADLAAVLRVASRGARVRRRSEPPGGFEAMMDRWQSSQRLALAERDGDHVLCSWPGELGAQARAVFGTDRAQRLAALVAAPGSRWTAVPRPHLAYNGARAGDRFYFPCRMTPSEYLAAWSRPEDLARVGGNPPESLREDLWPWLCRRGYADPTAAGVERELDGFLLRLERRRSHAHLRPGIELSSACDASAEAGQEPLRERVESRMRELAEVLREPFD